MEMTKQSVPRSMAVRCKNCKNFGTMLRSNPLRLCPEGRIIVKFSCTCENPKVDFENPY